MIKTKSSKLPFYFPLSTAYSHCMPETPPHTHDCIEIGIILEGSGTHESQGEVRNIVAGDVMVIHPGQIHSFPVTSHLNIFNILFEPDKINMPVQDLEKMPGFSDLFMWKTGIVFPCFHLDKQEFGHIRKIIALMRTEQKNIGRSGYRSAMLGLFMNLLCHLLRSYSAGVELSAKSEAEKGINNAVKYLNRHFLDPFVLGNLLKISAMSRSSFMSYFRTVTGYAPKQYVIRKRIAYAAKRITECKSSFTEIAMECGFHDSSHFSKAFKHVTGESPRAYRKRTAMHSDQESRWTLYEIENPFGMETIK
jgi:AraC family L-rhamnose operon transcriptional activator RhaR/AraC family L-rhamnose operon regulatory protein RhaS